MQAKLKTIDDIVTLARSKGALTAEQEAQIRAFAPAEKAEPATPAARGDSDPPWHDDPATPAAAEGAQQ